LSGRRVWLSSGVDTTIDTDRFAETPAGPWAEFDLGSDVSLADMHIWNYGEGSWPSWGKQGMQDVEIYYTTTGGGGPDSAWGSDSAGDRRSLSLVTVDQVNTRTITDVNGLPEVLSQEISARCFFIEQFKPA